MRIPSDGAEFLDHWIIDETALTFQHRSTRMIVKILCDDSGWSAYVSKPGLTTLRQRERLAQEVAEFFAAASGGNVQSEIAREIPADWKWPVMGFDAATASVQLRPGFVEDLATLYEMPLKKLQPNIIKGFLLSWYALKQSAGDPKDPVMEEILRYQEKAEGVNF